MLPVFEARRRDAVASPAGECSIPSSDRSATAVACSRASDQLGEEVAAAACLAEGAAGVRDILATIAGREPIPVRELSRWVEIPVPVVAAVCGELRRRGLVDNLRPVRLTARGRAALGDDALAEAALAEADWLRPEPCGTCRGQGTAQPARLGDALARLAALAGQAPPARPELDQSHCTAETKLRRALFLAHRGLLSRRLLFLGDDDLTSLAVALVAHRVGVAAPPVTVVDLDPRVLDYLRHQIPGTGAALEPVQHDLAAPLPASLVDRFDVVVTDPPYTLAGAEVFLSRAVAALAPGAGGHILLAFNARAPEETVALQELFVRMRLAVRSLTPHFNEYVAAGAIGGSSHLYHLRTTSQSRPSLAGRYRGALYTAEHRTRRTRRYQCGSCRAQWTVGPGQPYPQVADLRAAGCPRCGAHRFRPLARTLEAEPVGTEGRR